MSSDLWTPSTEGEHYFATFNDVATRCNFAIPLRTRAETREKLTPRSKPGSYMGIHDIKKVIEKSEDGSNHRVRATDLHPITPHTDPTKTTKMAFLYFAARLDKVPSTVVTGTSPPLNIQHDLRYPDHDQRLCVNDVALTKLGGENVIDWKTDIPINAHPLPLNMSYHYKWSSAAKHANAKRHAQSEETL